MLRQKVIADVSAVMVQQRLSEVVNAGVSLAIRSRVVDALGRGDWEGALLTLEGVPEAIPFIDRIFLADTKGCIRADLSHLDNAVGTCREETDWYKGVSKDWRPYVSDVFKRRSLPRRNVVNAAIPVRTRMPKAEGQGKILGILVLQMMGDHFSRLAQDIQLDADETLTIFDHRGNAVAHRGISPQDDILNISGTKFASFLAEAPRGYGEVACPLDKGKEIIAYANVADFGWKVVLEEPVSGLFDERDKILSGIRSFYILFSALGLLFALIIVRLFLLQRKNAILLGKSNETLEKERLVLFRLASIVEFSDDAIIGKDLDGTIRSWNIGAEKIYGYKEQEVLGKSIQLLFPEDVQQELSSIMEHIRKGERIQHFQTRRKRKDGVVIDVSLTLSPILDEKGGVTGVSSVARDITVEKSAEKHIRQAAEEWQKTFDSISDMVFLLDVECNLLLANKAVFTIMGVRPEQLAGKKCYELVHHSQQSWEKCPLQELLKDGKSHTGEATGPNGMPLLVTVSPILNEKQEIVGAVHIAKDITERKRAEAELKDSEERLRLLFEYAPDGYYLLDLAGTCIDGNRMTEELSGYKREELVGKNFLKLSLLPLSDIPRAAAALAKTALGQSTGPDEYVLNRKNGSKTTVEIRTYPLKVKGKTFVLGSARDVSARKRAEELLQDSEKKYRCLFEDSKDAMMTITPPCWRFTSGNAAALKLFGVSDPNAFSLLGLLDVSPEFQFDGCRSDEKARVVIEKAMSEGTAFFEWSHKQLQGHEFLATVLLSRVEISGQVYIQGTIRDVSQLKRAEIALRKAHEELELRVKERTAELSKSREYIEQIVSTITDYIYTVNVKDGKIVGTVHQPTCLGVTGYTAKEFWENPNLWIEIVHEEDRQMVIDFSEAIQAGKKTSAIEHRIRRKDGGIRWIRNTPVPHYDDMGRLVSYDGIVSDITEWKYAETLLIESMKRAEEANRAKSQFLANMSHEIRTPLSAIMGFSDLLARTTLDSTQKDYVATLRESGDLLLSLVTDILDFSKMEAKEILLEKIDFDIEYLVRSLIRINGAKLIGKQVKLFCTIEKGLPRSFKGDPTRIRQVLMNLLSNAIKFTEQGEIEVEVRLAEPGEGRSADKTRKVRLSVRDTGIGISPETQKNIFMPFEQADASTTRKYGGTGLGLSISKGLVAMMGGSISVKSEPGKGSIFSFVLPLEEIQPGAEKNSARSGAFAAKDKSVLVAGEDTGLKGLRILVVEDNAVTYKLLSVVLQSFGCETELAVNGRLGVDKVRTGSYDLVLMDLQMPVMGGCEASRLIRAEISKTIPILALTAAALEADKEKSLASGMNDYITKPIDIGSLKEKILQWTRARA
ncbi:MAG TPA: PAS domain S-box protein [Candidatus Omnitrophota bacterium]|nr:PAS domain S-box protein [Candidatus Omnitrophota bacterium]HPS36641.1 PAS domain S-box protein [Candidatus Omnitrophota bacterium]